jgi:anti-anti-sigma regulatory factor
MAALDDFDPRTIPVQHMRPGDHAYVGYSDDDALRDIMTAYAWNAVVRQEKLLIFAAPGRGMGDVWTRLTSPGALLADARAAGQVQLTSMRGLIRPHPGFTAERQWSRIREETRRALQLGYTGLRTFIDMHWVHHLGVDVAAVMHRETHADHLFTGHPYQEICAYDMRAFDQHVLDAMRDAHPHNLLTELGALHCSFTEGTLRMAGDADTANQDTFRGALTEALRKSSEAGRLRVDLSHLIFLNAACGTALLHAAAAFPEHRLIEVLCGNAQLRVLEQLGSAHDPRIALVRAEP